MARVVAPLLEQLSKGQHMEVIATELPPAVFRDYIARAELAPPRTAGDPLRALLEAHPRHRAMLAEIHAHALHVVRCAYFIALWVLWLLTSSRDGRSRPRN